MKAVITVILGAAYFTCEASQASITPSFLEAIRQVESSGGKFLHGDGGRSLGEFQIGKAAWADVSEWRRKQGLKTYPYHPHVFKPDISRKYAKDYLSILQRSLKSKLDRPPTYSELYAAYNMGFTQFARCGFDLDRVNRTTAERCKRVEHMAR